MQPNRQDQWWGGDLRLNQKARKIHPVRFQQNISQRERAECTANDRHLPEKLLNDTLVRPQQQPQIQRKTSRS